MEEESHGDSTMSISMELDLPPPRDAFMSASPEPVSTPSSEYERELDAKLPAKQRVSIYVQVFEEMIQTVLEHEAFLFNDEEKDLIARFAEMSCTCQYLLYACFVDHILKMSLRMYVHPQTKQDTCSYAYFHARTAGSESRNWPTAMK